MGLLTITDQALTAEAGNGALGHCIKKSSSVDDEDFFIQSILVCLGFEKLFLAYSPENRPKTQICFSAIYFRTLLQFNLALVLLHAINMLILLDHPYFHMQVT